MIAAPSSVNLVAGGLGVELDVELILLSGENVPFFTCLIKHNMQI